MKISEKNKEIIKSGNFTVISWDNGNFSFYKGIVDVDLANNEELEPFIEFDCEEEGYMPDAVTFLVECLGGKTDSV